MYLAIGFPNNNNNLALGAMGEFVHKATRDSHEVCIFLPLMNKENPTNGIICRERIAILCLCYVLSK